MPLKSTINEQVVEKLTDQLKNLLLEKDVLETRLSLIDQNAKDLRNKLSLMENIIDIERKKAKSTDED